MAKPFSLDLRERVVGAVEHDGFSRRQAAARFDVGISAVIVWLSRFRRREAWRPDKWADESRARYPAFTVTG